MAREGGGVGWGFSHKRKACSQKKIPFVSPPPSPPPAHATTTSPRWLSVTFSYLLHRENVGKLGWFSVQLCTMLTGFWTTQWENYTELCASCRQIFSMQFVLLHLTINAFIYLDNDNNHKELPCIYLLYTTFKSLYSKKLHIFGFRARTVVMRSRVIFFFSFWLEAVYHFCSLSLPWRLNSSINWN